LHESAKLKSNSNWEQLHSIAGHAQRSFENGLRIIDYWMICARNWLLIRNLPFDGNAANNFLCD